MFWGQRLKKVVNFFEEETCTPRENPGYAYDSDWTRQKFLMQDLQQLPALSGMINWADKRIPRLVPGAVATKPPPPVIFCQVGVSHYLRYWVDAASHIHTDSSQSYLKWRRRLWKITVNELLQFKTKFVSLIAKRQNKSCCWFHSFTLFTGTTLCYWCWREAHHLSMLSACFP